MFWTLIVLLLLFWVLGFLFDVAGGVIHVLLVIAAVVFLFNLIRGRRPRLSRASGYPHASALLSSVLMDVFVIPIGRDRYELYCEQPVETDVVRRGAGRVHRPAAASLHGQAAGSRGASQPEGRPAGP